MRVGNIVTNSKIDSTKRDNREKCLYNANVHSDMGLSDVCGKCLVKIPCSFVDPVKTKLR